MSTEIRTVDDLKTKTKLLAIKSNEERREAASNGETKFAPKINEVPLHPNLYAFLNEYFKVYKGLSLGVSGTEKWYWHGDNNKQHRAYKEVWIYKDNERYARGSVGYGPFRVDCESESVYMVYDRTIKNNKYRPNRNQHHMMLSSDMKSALKHAYKYLKPYHITEVAELDREDYKDSLHQVVYHKQNLAKAFLSDKLDTKDILRELRTMITTGHKFSSENFHNNLVQFFAKQDEADAASKKSTNAYYVFIRPGEGDESYADILEAKDVGRNVYGNTATYLNPTTVKMSDIPVDIAGKLAVINMLEHKHYCEGVGMKISNEVFWVERE